MDNKAMENFFGRLKVEMFYGEKFESVNTFIDELKAYIDYYNNERISLKLKGMSPEMTDIRHLPFEEASRKIVEYIELYYNSVRLHSGINYSVPNQFFTLLSVRNS